MSTARARGRSDGAHGEGDRSPERHHSGGVRRAVGPVAPSLQLKPAVVGAPGDAFEKEADQAADKVAQGKSSPTLSPVTPQALQRQAQVQVPAVSAEEVKEGGGIAQALFDEEEEKEEEPAQAKASTPAGPRSVDVPKPGAGAPLNPSTRSTLESGLGADLGGVRVHDDQAARSTADAMGAKAFTQGSDISLGSGQSADDVGLMAHEAAHVVQQAGGSGTVAQLADSATTATDTTSAPTPTKTADPDLPGGDAIDSTAKLVTLATFNVPETKQPATKLKTVTEVDVGREREDTQQKQEWEGAVASGAQAAAASVLAEPAVAGTKDDEGFYYLVHKLSPKQPIVVNADQFKELAVRPSWDREGVPRRFDIDHLVEWQLGGDDKAANLWLMEERANRSAGSMISNALSKQLKATFKKAKVAKVADVPADKAEAKAAGWKFSAKDIPAANYLEPTGFQKVNWAREDVATGVPVKDEHLRAMTESEMAAAGGSPERIVLFLGPMGGVRTEVEWGAKAKDGVRDVQDWWFYLETRKPTKKNNNYVARQISFVEGKGGQIQGTLFKDNKVDGKKVGPIQELDRPMKISSHAGGEGEGKRRIPWAGFIDKQEFLNEARSLTSPLLSPIELEEMDLAPDRALVARGRLLPTVPLIAKAELDVVIDGSEIYLSKLFTADDFSFPGPIKVGGCSLELLLGLSGLKINGEANFEIEGLGKGRIGAMAKANLDEVGFALEGEFNFLSDLFDPARVEVWYRDGELGGKGELGIKEGKVKGLKSANVVAEFGKEGIKANGTFATTIPGVESGTLAFAYKEDGTVELGGTLNLGSKLPGISSGSVEAQLVRNAEGGWQVFGKIQAVPSIPGIASQITGTYDDGAIQIETSVAYARGMAAGQLTIGVTNRVIDPTSGKPAGEPGTELSAYGGGQVSLTLAPWLKATAGLRLLPNGEIEVTGQIGLPDALEIFPRKSLDKELFKVGIDIPIIGFTVVGQRVGIFATVQGGAQLLAHFGPAELKELSLGVTWNPDHQDETTVKGHAALALPAGAGIKLFIKGGLGVGIPVVSATLGLTIGGYLGIGAEVRAAVDIDWTPARGLVLDAVAAASAEPKFIFSLMGFVSVDLDLLLKTINLYEKQWMLAAFEYGSGLRLGISLPIHYEEGKTFEPSLSDVTFEVPDIDPLELLSDLVHHVV